VSATEATTAAPRRTAGIGREARGQKARDRYIEIAAALKADEESTHGARWYVAQYIEEDRARGISICPMAEAFAMGTRSPYASLAAVDQRKAAFVPWPLALSAADPLAAPPVVAPGANCRTHSVELRTVASTAPALRK
jgi:hypothetical protein